jgi:hypothetical protein
MKWDILKCLEYVFFKKTVKLLYEGILKGSHNAYKCSAQRGGKGGEITPQTGAYQNNPAVTAFRVNRKVVAASELEVRP